MKTKNKRRRRRQTAYYVYAKANQMKEHKFTDDVALCKASSHSEAFKKFSKFYGNCTSEDVYKLNPNADWDGVLILTDY